MNKKLLLGSFFDGRLHLLLLLVGGQLVVGQEGCCAVKEVQGERKENARKNTRKKKQEIKHKIKNNIKLKETVISRAPEAWSIVTKEQDNETIAKSNVYQQDSLIRPKWDFKK